MTLEEALKKSVCRICQCPILHHGQVAGESVPFFLRYYSHTSCIGEQKGGILLNRLREHAHVDCLDAVGYDWVNEIARAL